MIVDIIMPKMGESIMEGTILKWLKKIGDNIERDESLLEISTDKVDTEVPSPESGILVEMLFKENDVVEVGKVIARLNTEADEKMETKITEKTSKSPDLMEEVKKSEKVVEKVSETHKDESGSGRFYSPLVLNIAKKEGIGISVLEKIKGSGLEGRVTKKDILDFIANKENLSELTEKEVKSEEKQIPEQQTLKESIKSEKPNIHKHIIDYTEEGLSIMEFDNIHQKMAEHMVESAAISPHVNAIAECDLTNVESVRKILQTDFEKKEGFKLTYMPFICYSVVKALKDFPLVNSQIDDSTVPFKAVTRSSINLGVAVAMDNGGLIVPVIKNADAKNLIGLARELNDLGKRAKVKKLTLEEIQGGTFTISNYGVFGNIIGTMIINQPQVAILGVGAAKKRPSVLETPNGDFVVIKPMMYLTLSFDHRLIDGALGGKFVMRVVQYLENFKMENV
jgi:2-oxoglutarate dehydrogenase E2 component (dihydrolipoamide succinyltransferase)